MTETSKVPEVTLGFWIIKMAVLAVLIVISILLIPQRPAARAHQA